MNILGLSLCHGVILCMSFNTNIEKYFLNASLTDLSLQTKLCSFKNWNMQFIIQLNTLTNNHVLDKSYNMLFNTVSKSIFTESMTINHPTLKNDFGSTLDIDARKRSLTVF